MQRHVPNVALHCFFSSNLSPVFFGEKGILLFNVAFVMTDLDLMSCVHLASLVARLPKQFK